MSCPAPASFDNCKPKCVCRYSGCADIPYDCSDPCGNGNPSTFDKATCTCKSGGVYLVTQVRAGQSNPQNDGTRCYLVQFPEPFFDALGRYAEVRWMKLLQKWPGGPGTPGSAFSVLEPNTEEEASGFIYDNNGAASNVYPWDSNTSNSVIGSSNTYCENSPDSLLAHNNGTVCFGAVFDGTNINTLKFIPYATNGVVCTVSRTGTVNISRQYIGPGFISDYYNRGEYAESSTGFWPIINPSDGTFGCFGPTKTP